jgi:hypothetical protein
MVGAGIHLKPHRWFSALALIPFFPTWLLKTGNAPLLPYSAAV